MTHRYRKLSSAFRAVFGRRARKIPLDAGSACPNRDGTISRGGCLFCNAAGSGTGLHHKGFGLRTQWDVLAAGPIRRGEALIAYLQSFSNTHGPASRLAGLLHDLAGLPGISGLSLGTRPDCLDEAKLDLLAGAPVAHLRLEMGLQSASDATLARINRGHTAACFAAAARAAADRGLWVTAHAMAGLPGETQADFLATIDFLNALPVSGVKLHNCLVVAGAPLAGLYAAGAYEPLARSAYVDCVAAAIARLRPDIIIERVNADPAPGELIAPAWAADKRGLLREIEERLEADDVWQGDGICRRKHSIPIKGSGGIIPPAGPGQSPGEVGPGGASPLPAAGGVIMTMTETCVAKPLALELDWEGDRIVAIKLYWAEGRQASVRTEAGAALAQALTRYVAGREPDWPELPLNWSRLSPFARQVLETLLRQVPYGQKVSYGWLAARAGRPRAARAVGRIMAHNPFPLIIPCHRVVGSTGALTGFGACGLEMKSYLLSREGADDGKK